MGIFSVSCATAPSGPIVPGEAAQWLGGTPRVVVRLNASKVAAWGQVTGSREALKAVGDRTKTIWMGFELDNLDDLKTAADTVKIVLEGDFPRAAAGLMLDWNSSWKKTSAAGVWTNAKLALSVSLPGEGLVAVRRNDPSPAQASVGVLRDLDAQAVVAADAWISFWNPGQAFFGETGARLLPIERLDVILTSQDGRLEGPVLLRFSNERAAKAATVLLKFLGPTVQSRFGQELEWSVEGSTVIGSNLKIAQADLKALAEKLVADSPEKKEEL